MSYTPEQPSIYQGKQVIINSDRLLFNAKEDSILLFSNKAIGFSTNGSFHFDTSKTNGNKFVVNAPDMYFGLQPNGNFPTEPALLGDKTEGWLNDLLYMLEGLVNHLIGPYTLTSTLPGTPCAPFGGNAAALGLTLTQINDLKAAIIDIKSKRIKLI